MIPPFDLSLYVAIEQWSETNPAGQYRINHKYIPKDDILLELWEYPRTWQKKTGHIFSIIYPLNPDYARIREFVGNETNPHDRFTTTLNAFL